MDKKLNAKDVEIFLLENIDFFVSRESLVSELSFKHDSGGASSLLEMQVRRLRDEQSRLMEMLTSLVSTGQDNEDLFLKSKKPLHGPGKNIFEIFNFLFKFISLNSIRLIGNINCC